jgi:hypothetical protein
MDPSTISALTALPWNIQLVTASGYCAYLVAYVGIRYNHKATDTVFASLAFGLVALFVLSAPIPVGDFWQGAIAFLASVLTGIAWRAKLRIWARRIARKLNYSWADNTAAAWDRLLEECDYGPTQLTVEMDDGRYLQCTNAERVGHLPFGPYVLGTTGDVLMYVDQTQTAAGEIRKAAGTYSDDWGAMVTYIPKDHIKKISVRLLPVSRPAGEAEEKTGWLQALVGYLRRRRPPAD